MEEEYVENMCMEIIAFQPDVVITEKGVSDLAQHYFAKANITAFRRLRKTDNNRVARATGATIVSRTDEIQESDIGTKCGLFEMRKLGDNWFCYLEECEDPKGWIQGRPQRNRAKPPGRYAGSAKHRLQSQAI